LRLFLDHLKTFQLVEHGNSIVTLSHSWIGEHLQTTRYFSAFREEFGSEFIKIAILSKESERFVPSDFRGFKILIGSNLGVAVDRLGL
jgi:hypothetical protein